MKCSVTIKNGSLDITSENLLERQLNRLKKRLHNFKDDLTELTVFIRRHERHHFYSGVLTLYLPKKPLTAQTGSHSLPELLKDGFEKIEKEFETYKGKHFKGSSKYGDHKSIRHEERF